MCVGRSGASTGIWGQCWYPQERECDSVSPAVHYKPGEGCAVLGAGVGTPCVCRALWLCCGVSLVLPVCSDARNMARDVQNTFYEIVSEFGNMSQPQAVDYVKKLMTKGRYSLDVWS